MRGGGNGLGKAVWGPRPALVIPVALATATSPLAPSGRCAGSATSP